jgi:hypothetical protein
MVGRRPSRALPAHDTTITLTATASGGTAPYQYKWWVSTDAEASHLPTLSFSRTLKEKAVAPLSGGGKCAWGA